MANAETLKDLLKQHEQLRREVAKIEAKIRAKDPRALKERMVLRRVEGLSRMVPISQAR
jgi:hypothetical protein